MTKFQELREQVVEAAIAWEADRSNLANRDALIAAIQALRQRSFYKDPEREEASRVPILIYDRGNERAWAFCAPQYADRMIQALNDRLAAGWDPGP